MFIHAFPVYDKYVNLNDTGSPEGKVFRIGTVRYNWSISAHASQAFSIVHYI